MPWRSELLRAAVLASAAGLRWPAAAAGSVVRSWQHQQSDSLGRREDFVFPDETRAALEAAPGITRLVSTGSAFAAVTTEGRVLTWGGWRSRGGVTWLDQPRLAALEAAPGVAWLVPTGSKGYGADAFAAVTTEGRVMTWGSSEAGGDIPDETRAALEAAPGIVWLVSTYFAFVAVACTQGDYPFRRFDNTSTMCYPDGTCGLGFTPVTRRGSDPSFGCKRCPSGRVSAAEACQTTCNLGTYEDDTAIDEGGGKCVACPAGRFGTDMNTTHRAACVRCGIGTFNSVTGGTNAANCTRCPTSESSAPGSRSCSKGESASWRSVGLSMCPEGKDVDQSIVATWLTNSAHDGYYLAQPCAECPHRMRCPGVGNCSKGATGNLCGSCQPHYYNIGPLCFECSDSMVVPALIAVAVAASALCIFWRLTKTAGTNAAEMNCVLSFGSKKGGFEVAQELKHTMAEQFSWPSDSIYMDCDAMEVSFNCILAVRNCIHLSLN